MNAEVKPVVTTEFEVRNQEPPKSGEKESFLKYWPAFTAVLAGVVYLQGYLYARGYADGYGVELSLLGLQQQEYFIYAFLAYVTGITKLMPFHGAFVWFAIILGLTVFVFLSAGFIVGKVTLSDRWNKKINEFRQSAAANSLLKNGALGAAISLGLLYLSYIVALVLLFLMWPYKVGGTTAEESKAKFQICQLEEKPANQHCTYLINGDTYSVSGKLLADSERATLIYDGSGVHVIRKNGDQLYIANKPGTKSN